MIAILYVDDEEPLLHLCKRYLGRSSDLEIDTVPSVADAEKMLIQKKYDAIVSDFQMPWNNGIEFLKRLRSRKDETPFVLFIEKGMEEVVIEALNSGADSYVHKDSDAKEQFSELENRVREAVHRRMVERSLRLKNNFFDDSLAANLITDSEGAVTVTNPSFLRTWGYETDDILKGMPVQSFLNCADVADVIETALNIFGKWEGDVTAKKKDGSTFVAYVLITTIQAENGEIGGYQATSIPISDLDKAEQRGLSFLELSSDRVLMVDRELQVLDSNLPMDEGKALKGRSVLELVGENDRGTVQAKLEEVLRTGRSGCFETSIPDASGRQIWQETKAGPVYKEGAITAAILISRTVTDRKDIEHQLRESAEGYRSMADHSADWIEMRELSGNCTYSSSASLDISGYAPEEIIGLDIDQFTHPEDKTDVHRCGKELLQNDGPVMMEHRFKRKDGNYIWLESKGRVVRNDSGHPVKIIFSHRDISKRKMEGCHGTGESERQMENHLGTDGLEGLLAIRSLMTLEREKASGPESMDRFEKMDDILVGMIDQVEFAQERQLIGKEEPEWRSVQTTFKNASTKLDVDRVHLQLLAQRLEILADQQLEKAFHHLIENTLKHGKKAHKIWVTYELEADHAKIIYEDNGVGISEGRKAHLFDPGNGKRQDLFLAKSILQATGLDITEKGMPGKGVRFEITVPKDRYRLK